MSYPTPNLLLSNAYALNASDSKRVNVGLEWYGGLYRPVVKFSGAISPASAVTLDNDAWGLFTHQQETINNYFKKGSPLIFEKPPTLTLNSAEISFTRCFGARAIVISQLPTPPVRDFRYEEKFDAQLPEDTAQEGTPKDKKKNDYVPTITMQATTYYGLRELIQCIDLRMSQLEEQALLVNRIVDQIIHFLKEKMTNNFDAEVKNSLMDYNSFKQYFSLQKKQIYSVIFKSLNFFNLNQNSFELIFEEIYAFGLYHIAKHLYKELYE